MKNSRKIFSKKSLKKAGIIFIIACPMALLLALLPEATIESALTTMDYWSNIAGIYAIKILIAVFGGIIVCLVADSAMDYLINIFSAEPKKKSKILLLLKSTLSLGILGIAICWLITLSWVNAAAQFAVNLLFW